MSAIDPKTAKRALADAFDAAVAGSTSAIDAAIDLGIAVDVKDPNGFTLLHHAASRGHIDVVRALTKRLAADVDVEDARGRVALHHAASLARDDVLEFLITQCDAMIDASDEDGETALVKACRFGEASTVKILTVRGADAKAKNDDGCDAFIEALCVRGDVNIGRLLIASGVDPKRSRARCGKMDGNRARSALVVACGLGRVEAVRYLVGECGFDAAGTDSGESDYMTPLMAAALMGQVKVIEYLLLSGAAATAHLTSDDGATAADMFPDAHARKDIKSKLREAAVKAASSTTRRSVVATVKSEMPSKWASKIGKVAMDPLELRMRSWVTAGVATFEGVPHNVREMLESYAQLTKEAELREFLLGLIEDELFQDDMAVPDVRFAVDEVIADYHNVMKYRENRTVMRVLNKFRHVQRFCKDRGEKISFDDVLVNDADEVLKRRERVGELKAAAGVIWDDALVALKVFMKGEDINVVAAANLKMPSAWNRVRSKFIDVVENIAVQGLASIMLVVVLSVFWKLGGFARLTENYGSYVT